MAIYAAVAWLTVLTILNLVTQGALRSTLLFAVPVCIVAWYRWQTGFVVAAAAILCAGAGHAMPEPDSASPLAVDALIAFAKLTIDATVANAWGRRVRAKAEAKAPSEGGDADAAG